MNPWTDIAGDTATGLLLIGDHASNRVPEGVDLGVPDAVIGEHVAIDIGVAELGAVLCARLGCPGILANVSRLVIDLNREEDAPGLIPTASDGYAIPGNVALDAAGRRDRVERLWRPYHAHLGATIVAMSTRLIVSLHSFTPRLRQGGAARPWQIGILYNQDDRAPRIAIPALAAAGVVVGDNEPYSGRVLNATMNRHAEANGIPYLGIEVRQDLIDAPHGVEHWCNILASIIAQTASSLRCG